MIRALAVHGLGPWTRALALEDDRAHASEGDGGDGQHRKRRSSRLCASPVRAAGAIGLATALTAGIMVENALRRICPAGTELEAKFLELQRFEKALQRALDRANAFRGCSRCDLEDLKKRATDALSALRATEAQSQQAYTRYGAWITYCKTKARDTAGGARAACADSPPAP